MPIQPRAPTLRAKAFATENGARSLSGVNVPASISWRRKGAHFLAQFLRLGRQVDRIEMKIVGHRLPHVP